MAEVVEEVIEGVEEAIDGAEEGIDELSEEVREEVEEEIAEARAEVAEFSKFTESLKTFLDLIKTSIPKIAGFVTKNALIGVILWGVNVALNKLLPHESADVKKKRDAIKALSKVIKTETELSKKLLAWMKEHQDDTIVLEDIEVPLESILAKYITPVSKVAEDAFKVANALQEKFDGKTQYKIPNGEDMRLFLDAADAFLKAFTDLIEFVFKNTGRFEVLSTFSVKQTDLAILATQLSDAKDLPLW